AEAPADLGQRAGGELLGEIHPDLPRPHHRAVPALREDVPLRYAEMTGHDLEDVLDLDAPRLHAMDQLARHRLGDVERDGRAHVLPGGVEPSDRALELAAALSQSLGQQLENVARHLERGIEMALLMHALLENAQPEIEVGRADLGDQPALEARAHALVEFL